VKRLWLVVIAAIVIELSRGYFTPPLEALPSAPAGWARVAQTAFNPVPHELQEWPETSHAVKAWRATYSGTSPITLTLYAMPWSPGSAWDAIQRWRPVPGAMAFAKSRYFGVAVSPGADQATLKRFVQGVLATLPRGAETIR
jgi:hypothetical protein